MKWLLEQIIENPPDSYSPERVKQIVDSHQETLIQIKSLLQRPLICIGILSIILAFWIIRVEIRLWKIEKK